MLGKAAVSCQKTSRTSWRHKHEGRMMQLSITWLNSCYPRLEFHCKLQETNCKSFQFFNLYSSGVTLGLLHSATGLKILDWGTIHKQLCLLP